MPAQIRNPRPQGPGDRPHPSRSPRKRCVTLLAGVLGASCTFVSAAGEPPAQSEIVVAGDWRHPSGAVFPEQIAGFRRGTITAYGADGNSAAVAYQVFTPMGGLPVFVTVYVYPRKGQ